MKNIKIYTDGACSGNPGPGGAAYVAIVDENTSVGSMGYKNTTNNRMELVALKMALSFILGYVKEHGDNAFTIYSDSQYVVNTMLGQFKVKSNQDLWDEVFNLIKLIKSDSVNTLIHYQKVAGHSGEYYNEMADAEAVRASKAPLYEDSGYMEICKPSALSVVSVILGGFDGTSPRMIGVLLSDNQSFTIKGYMGHYVTTQFPHEVESFVMEIGNRFSGWLNGGEL